MPLNDIMKKVVRRRLRKEGARIDDDDEVDKSDLVITRRYMFL